MNEGRMTPPDSRRRALLLLAGAGLLPAAHAQDAVERLRAFVRDTKSGQSAFTQVVTSADGKRRRTSSGEFAFARPDRFRFVYRKPFEQTLVSDGQKVWMHDPDLNQVSSRKLGQALASTPAALLAGGALEPAFALAAEPPAEGLDWVKAMPQARDGAFQWMRVGFRGNELAVIEVLDSFGQRTRLEFARFEANATIPADRFRFVVPAGADLVEQ
jgi:outer membrane lipoprotein carrier protein